MLSDLRSHRLSCAPHVLARVVAQLGGDRQTIRDVVARLDPEARDGRRPLPWPLPMVASIEVRYDGIEWETRDRDLLLAAALCLDDELEPLLDFDGRTADELRGGVIGRHLVLRAGRATFVDPLLEVWMLASAEASTEAAVHERLAAVFSTRGELVAAHWHRARASTLGVPEAASELTRVARELSESGHPDRALLLAREAALHADGPELDEARQVAGAAAIGAGYTSEAVSWLGMLFPDGEERFRLQGLGGLLVAQAHLQGAVPDVDPGAFRPRSGDGDDWYSWTRAAAFAAVLCAERGDRARMRVWLDALREGSARVGADSELRDPVVTLAWLVAGERDLDDAEGAGPLSGGMLRALRAATEGDIDRGLRLIAAGDSGLDADVDPFVAGFELSPIVNAYRVVIEVLLLTWRGELGRARERLLSAALELPVALPFAGLGVVLARRLDLAVLGHLGPVSDALTSSLPPAIRIDRLVDHAIEAYLRGAVDEASSFLALWRDHGSPQTALAIPGLEELARDVEEATPAVRRVAPPDLADARRLMRRIAGTPDARWRVESVELAVAARSLGSPFARGRIESLLGVRAAVCGDRELAREHLRAAVALLDLAGAAAWSSAAAERLSRLDVDTHGGMETRALLPACRRAWEPVLTTRELDVAMRVVDGGSNRVVADELSVSVRTVEVHLGRVFTKLGVRSRVELTVLAHRTGRLV